MTKFEEAQQYRDKFGLNQLSFSNGQGDVSQNGALFTLEYLIWLVNDPDVPDHIKKAEIERLREVYKSLEIFPGVSVRSPGSNEFDSMDNTGAIAGFSGLFDGGRFSKLSYDHGNSTHAKGIDMTQDVADNTKYYTTARWVSVIWSLNPVSLYRFIRSGFAPKMFWNNNTPDQFCCSGWHGRSPGHVAFLKMTGKKFVGPFGFLSVLVGQFLGCFKEIGDTDARKLPYCHWQFLKNRSILWKLFYKLWCFILTRQYGPEGMKAVYSQYYQDPNHFLRKYSKPYIK